MSVTKKGWSPLQRQVLIRRNVAAEPPVGNLNKRVPAALDIDWTDYRTAAKGYDKSVGCLIIEEDSIAEVVLFAQQQLASALLKLWHPTTDGRLRVSKRKLAVLFNKIGISI